MSPPPDDRATMIGRPAPQPPAVPTLARPRGSRLLIPACGVALLGLFAGLYRADHALYMQILVSLTRNPFPHPFIDWEWIPSAVECWHRGVDVYADNTCYEPILHSRHNYSPLWLRMSFLPPGKAWLAPFGLGFGLLFFAALATLPPQRRSGAIWVTFLATFSSMTAFAIERGNVDLIMFELAIAGVNCCLGPPRLRLLGYGIFTTAGLLKFYPFVLLALALRERPRVFAGIFCATLGVAVAFGLAFHDELARAGAHLPGNSCFGDIFASTNLPNGLVVLATIMAAQPGVPAAASSALTWTVFAPAWLVLTLTACVLAVRLLRRFELDVALAALPAREAGFLVAGALLTCGCFFATQNVGYRAIMILPTLPGLLWFAHSLPDRTARIAFTASCATVVFVMWKIAISQLIVSSDGGIGLFLLHWLVDELAWWWLVSVLLAVLFAFLLNSTTGRLAARFIGLKLPPQRRASDRT